MVTKRFILLILLCAIALPHRAEARNTTTVVFTQQSNLYNPSGMGGYGIHFNILNDYQGVELDSLQITGLIEGLADSIAQNNPYTDKQTVIDNMLTQIATGSNVKDGWYTSMDTNGVISAGHKDGRPGDYETFGNGNSMMFNVWGDLKDLDSNGDGVYNSLQDLTLSIDTNNPYINGVIGTTAGGAQYGGNIDKIEAVPPISEIVINSGNLSYSDHIIAIGFSNNTSGYTKLQFSIDNGVTFASIDNSLHLAGPVYWHIPAGIDSESCIIQATAADGTAILGTSEPFSIKPCSVTADLTGDCYVDLEDLAMLACQWLEGEN